MLHISACMHKQGIKILGHALFKVKQCKFLSCHIFLIVTILKPYFPNYSEQKSVGFTLSSYFPNCNTSGAIYRGEPQTVSAYSPGRTTLIESNQNLFQRRYSLKIRLPSVVTKIEGIMLYSYNLLYNSIINDFSTSETALS